MSRLLALQDLAIGYERRVLLSGINLLIEEGDFWGIVGPNGAGKTTLIKTIIGILQPLAGRIERARRLTFGYVPQRGVIDDIYPLTALDVVLMGRYARVGLLKWVTRADRKRALMYMAQMGIADLAKRPFRSLSGGQKQRVLLARGLVTEPDLLFLDEPTDGMDIAGETDIMELIADLHGQASRAIVMITHTLNLVANYAQKLMIIHGNEGVFKTGTTAELMNGEALTDVYQLDIDVQSLAGRTFVFAQKRPKTGMEE